MRLFAGELIAIADRPFVRPGIQRRTGNRDLHAIHHDRAARRSSRCSIRYRDGVAALSTYLDAAALVTIQVHKERPRTADTVLVVLAAAIRQSTFVHKDLVRIRGRRRWRIRINRIRRRNLRRNRRLAVCNGYVDRVLHVVAIRIRDRHDEAVVSRAGR